MFNQRSVGVVGLGAFLIVNTPSLKLVTGVTPLVNAAATAVLFAAGLYRVLAYRQVQRNVEGWTLFFGLWVFILLSVLPEHFLLRDVDTGHVTGAIRMIYALACVGVIAATATRRDVDTMIRCQIAWGVGVAACYVGGIIDYGFAQTLHYKTVSLPVALSILAILAHLIEQPSIRKRTVALGLAAIAVDMVALTSLFSRSPFIFVVAIVAGFTIVKRYDLAGKVKASFKVVAYAALAVLVVWGGLTYANVQINIPAFNRISSLTSQGDSRIAIWTEALRIINDHPFGLGWGAYEGEAGILYPHNLVLEAGVVTGVAGGVLMLAFLLGYAAWVSRTYPHVPAEDRSRFVQMAYVGFYFCATFLVSYSLGYSYMMFVALAMTTAFPQRRPSTSHVLRTAESP
jgi:hypothetical protein